jgi:tetratricopeptide (TPR) repeat protein
MEARFAAHDSAAPAAYEQARFFYARRAPGDIPRAIGLYGEALQRDPRFAPAWVGLAAAYRIQVADGAIANDVGISKRRFAVENALRIDPRLAPAHIEAARLAWDNGDDAGASEHARAALRWEEAKAEFARQFDLNPAAEAETSVATAFILILEHRFDEALAAIERWPSGDDKSEALAMMGSQGEADAALRALSSQRGLAPAVRVAEVFAFRGEVEKAFHVLEGVRAGITRDNSSLPDSVWIWQMNFSPFLRPLRDDARWAHIRLATGKPAASMGFRVKR